MFSDRAKEVSEERGPRLLEVRVTKIGAAFSGNAEGCVDRV